jgi:hemoglobin-like flavoprotein
MLLLITLMLLFTYYYQQVQSSFPQMEFYFRKGHQQTQRQRKGIALVISLLWLASDLNFSPYLACKDNMESVLALELVLS